MIRLWIGLAVASALNAQPDLTSGKKIFESQCALCHGQTGGGGRGPVLARPNLFKAPDDAALRKVISEGIQPEMPGAWQLNPHEVESVAGYVRSLGSIPQEAIPGDAARGERVYQAQGCSGCHMIGGKGSGFGPELTGIGARRSAAYLRATILEPAASVPDRFQYIAAVLDSGESVRGIRVNEDSFTIQLKAAGGRFYSLRKSTLKDLRRLTKETPMPSYQGKISASDLDDLIAWLAASRGTL